MIKKLLRIFNTREKISAVFLLGLMVIGAGLETLGIGLILPFVGLVGNPDLLATQSMFANVRQALGITSHSELLFLSGAALLALYLFKNVYLAALNYAQFKFIFDKQAKVSQSLFSAYLQAPYVFHLQRNSSELIRNFTTEISGLFAGVVAPLFSLAAEVTVLLAILAFLLYIEPAVTLALIIVVGIIATGLYFAISAALRSSSQRRAENSKLQIKLVNQGIGSLREIRILGKALFFQKIFAEAASRYAGAARIFSTVNACPRLALESLAAVGLVAVVLFLSSTKNPQTAIPALAMFGMAALRVMPSMSRIMSAISSIRFYRPALDAVLTDLMLAEDLGRLSPASAAPEDCARNTRIQFADKISIADLSYHYPATDTPAISHLSAEITKGSSVAFVGFSGSGKSTLVDLILGLLTPTGGCISVDGSDIQAALPAWQRHFGYVPQTIYLLDDSVRRNIAFGVEDSAIDDSKVWRALEAARLAEKFREQPDGLDAHVGERGVRLSGGERQRIGIARALFHEPDILVFDEATSALDNQTEREVAETINTLRNSKTLIMIAHRLSSIINCDRIHFMKSGTVVDSGTFEEIVARNEDFRKMIGRSAETPASG
jgi:ATP-binding cassette, subfamily B, bacterial PglK